MKAGYAVSFTIFVVLAAFFTLPDLPQNPLYALTCSPIKLGDAFVNSEHVFHGKVTNKNYLTWDEKMPIVTFEVIESFKGSTSGSISATVNERWDYIFEEEFEYVVFVRQSGAFLEIGECHPSFQAFPSVIQIVRQASVSDSEAHASVGSIFYESLTEQEKAEYEKNRDLIQEKRVERWDSVRMQRLAVTVMLLALIIAVGAMSYKLVRKRK